MRPLRPLLTAAPLLAALAGCAPVHWEHPTVGTAYLDAENRYADAVMKPLEGFRDTLYKEFLSRIKETDESVPYRHHGHWYYVREVQGLQYPIYCRRKGGMDAPEEVMLDVNELAKGHAYCSVGLIDVSPDAKWLAYTVDFVGYRQYALHVKDLETGDLARESAVRVTSTAWAADNRTLFYVQEHEGTKRSYQLHRIRVGEPEHTLVYEEPDERFDMIVCDTRSEKFIVLGISSKDTTDIRIVESDRPLGEFRALLPRREGLLDVSLCVGEIANGERNVRQIRPYARSARIQVSSAQPGEQRGR